MKENKTNLVTHIECMCLPALFKFGRYFDSEQIESSLLLLITLVVSIIIFLLVFSCIRIKSYNNRVLRKKGLKNKYQNYLSYVVSGQKFKNSKNKELNLYLTKEDISIDANRKILIKEIMSLRQVLQGKEKDKLNDIYLGLGFASEIPKRIRSRMWQERLQAVNEIGEFNLSEYTHLLDVSLLDENQNVSKASFIRLASLKSNPVDALIYIKPPINLWEKSIIVNNLKNYDNKVIPIIANYYEFFPEFKDFLDELTILLNQQNKIIDQLNEIESVKFIEFVELNNN